MSVYSFISRAVLALLFVFPMGVSVAETPLPAPQPFVDAPKATAPVHHVPVKKVVKKSASPVKKKVAATKAHVAKQKTTSKKVMYKPVLTAKKKPVKNPLHKKINKSVKPTKKPLSAAKSHKPLEHSKTLSTVKANAKATAVVAGATVAATVGESTVGESKKEDKKLDLKKEAKSEVENKKAELKKEEKSKEEKVSASSEDDRPIVETQPSYAYLKTRMVHMRRGPGQEYPIDWVYSRRGLPMKILMRYRDWRKVEDPYGTVGWMKLVTLRNGRHFVVTGASVNGVEPTDQNAKEVGGDPVVENWVDPDLTSAHNEVVLYKSSRSRTPIAYLKSGVVGQIISCQSTSSFCTVRVGKYEGSILKDHIWGVEKDENLEPVKNGFFR